MMQGYVNTGYEAVISLVIKHNSTLKSINAVIDTGFTGFLSLPQSIIDELELPWRYSDFATLGDGSETRAATISGSVRICSRIPRLR
jgi:predicted aspartyl protease